MSSQITNITEMPRELNYHVFGYLNRFELSACCQVSKEFHAVANINGLWSGVPLYPEERTKLFAELAELPIGTTIFIPGEATAQDLQDRIIEFIQTPLRHGQIGHLVITFAHVPSAHISFWMGEGCKFRFDGNTFSQSRDHVICDPNNTVERRYTVLTRGEDIVELPHGNGQAVSLPGNHVCPHSATTSPCERELFASGGFITPFNRRYNARGTCNRQMIRLFNMSYYDVLPDRWFYTSHMFVGNWSWVIKTPGLQGNDCSCGSFERVHDAATQKMEERDERSLDVITGSVVAACTTIMAVGHLFF